MSLGCTYTGAHQGQKGFRDPENEVEGICELFNMDSGNELHSLEEQQVHLCANPPAPKLTSIHFIMLAKHFRVIRLVKGNKTSSSIVFTAFTISIVLSEKNMSCI